MMSSSTSRTSPSDTASINIADPGDVIAVHRGLTHYFDGVDADLTTPIGVFDIHKSADYLSCPSTAAALAPLLGR